MNRAHIETPPWWLRIIIGKSLRRTLTRALILVILVFITVKMILLPVRIHGISMEPTYRHGQINFVNKLAYLRRAPQRGDVVGVQFSGESVMLFKRIIGLPGERVLIRNGTVFINGVELEEEYVRLRSKHWEKSEVALGPDEYFFIGDNRSMDPEVHEHGRRERKRIVGKVLF